MYKISVTVLEKFRRYMTEASQYDTEEALIESIKGVFLGNDKTKTGGAFHKLIEGDYRNEGSFCIADDIAFLPDQAEPAFEFKQKHPLMVHEISVFKDYIVGPHSIRVTGRVDGLDGINIHDSKTKFRSIKYQEYLDSYQWRYYLDILELDNFYYQLFEVIGFESLCGSVPHKLPGVLFIPHEPLQCLRYKGMETDCLNLIIEFMTYIDNRNYYHLLKTVDATAIA